MKNLLLGSILSAGIKLASAGLTFLMFVFLARVMAPEVYGQFAAMFSLGTIGAIAALLGQHTLGMKTLSGLEPDPALNATRRHFIWRSYGMVMAGVGGCVALACGAWALERLFGVSVGALTMLGACLLILPFALAELVSFHSRAFGSIAGALVPRDVLWRGAVVGLCLGAAFVPGVFASALSAMLTISGLLLGLVVLQFFGFSALFRDQLIPHARHPSEAAGLPRFSLWLWLAALVTMGANLNVVVTAALVPADQVGAYFAAQKTSQLLQLPILAINIVAGPRFARLYARGDRAGLQQIARRMALILLVPLALGALVVMLWAPAVLGLFDPAFVVAVPVLLVLAASHLFMGLGGPFQQLMLMADGERMLVQLTAGAEIAGLVMIPVLVPFFGILGAALGVLATKLLLTILALIWCRRHLQVDTSVLALIRA